MNKYHGTVKEFLEAGHRFVDGDVRQSHSGTMRPVVKAHLEWINDVEEWSYPDESYVVYAACLNKEPEPEYELEQVKFGNCREAINAVAEGDDLCDSNGNEAFIVNGEHASEIVRRDDFDTNISYKSLYRRIPLRTKTATYPMPETKAPEVGADYFSVNQNGSVSGLTWTGGLFDSRLLAAGNVFLKREHAQAKADAQAVQIDG
jgi:hypothetical protein